MKKIQIYPGYSPLMVLESAAGFYIGRLWYDEPQDPGQPYSRNSHYFRDRTSAEVALGMEPDEYQAPITN